MANKKSFVMYMSWQPMIDAMTAEQAGELLKAIYAYQSGIEYAITDPAVKIIFATVAATMKEDADKYAAKCAKNTATAQTRERNKRERNNTNVHERSRTLVDSDSESESDSDSDTESDSDKHKKHKRVYAQDERLDAAIREFIKHRQKMRKPMTDHAVDLLLTKLAKITTDIDEQVKLLDTAIEKGWQTVYPPKEETRTGSAYMDAIANRVSVVDSWV